MRPPPSPKLFTGMYPSGTHGGVVNLAPATEDDPMVAAQAGAMWGTPLDLCADGAFDDYEDGRVPASTDFSVADFASPGRNGAVSSGPVGRASKATRSLSGIADKSTTVQTPRSSTGSNYGGSARSPVVPSLRFKQSSAGDIDGQAHGISCSSPTATVSLDTRLTSSPPAWCDRRPLSSRMSAGGKVTPRGTPTQVQRRTSAPAISTEGMSSAAEATSSTAAAVDQAPMLPGKGDVSLCVRLRPSLEEDACVYIDSVSSVRLRLGPAYQELGDPTYRCDHAFGPDASQEHVYQQSITPICDAVIRGYNGAVIAYGQTGSGKTHTMIGNARNKGMAPRAVAEIFDALSKRPCWSVEVSVLEIYNERVRDLLSTSSTVTHVDIHEVVSSGEGPASFRCPDATHRSVTSPDEALAALNDGARRRETARTDMNHSSSRSHLIFTICATQRDHEIGATLRGRLHLVDLAGSERLKRSMSSERSGSMGAKNISRGSGIAGAPRTPRDQRKEAGDINKSLSQLALVIQRLTGPPSIVQYVPYRDSMLTRLLAESFGGNSKTCLVITCSSRPQDREETRCSLEFGKRAKLVRNKAEINLEVHNEPTPVVQALVAKEIMDLQKEREVMLQDRELLLARQHTLQEQLTGARNRASAAESEILVMQERRQADISQFENEKDQLQKKWLDATHTAAEVQEAFTMQATRLCDERSQLHQRLQEVRALHEVQREEMAAATEKQRNLVEDGLQKIGALHSQVKSLIQEKQEKIDDVARLEKENASIRERWFEEVFRMGQEKAALVAELEQVRGELPTRLEAVLRGVNGHNGYDSSSTSDACLNVETSDDGQPSTRGLAGNRDNGTRQAQQDAEQLIAACVERGLSLRQDLEAVKTTAAGAAERRQLRLTELEVETAQLQQKWRPDAGSASTSRFTAGADASSAANFLTSGTPNAGSAAALLELPEEPLEHPQQGTMADMVTSKFETTCSRAVPAPVAETTVALGTPTMGSTAALSEPADAEARALQDEVLNGSYGQSLISTKRLLWVDASGSDYSSAAME